MIQLLHAAVGCAKLVGRFLVGKIYRAPYVTAHQSDREAEVPWANFPNARQARVLDEIVERIEEQRSELTIQDQRESALSFAYETLVSTQQHKPDRFAFWQVAQNDGWSAEDFNEWAAAREWDE
jgi:hypothetical protein